MTCRICYVNIFLVYNGYKAVSKELLEKVYKKLPDFEF